MISCGMTSADAPAGAGWRWRVRRPICRACRTSPGPGRRLSAGSTLSRKPLKSGKTGRRQPQMMRQYELVERVQRYNPNADEALLNRAYVYAMKAHGDAEARLGRPLFLPSARSRGDPDRPQLDDATIAAALLHDTIEDTDGDARGDRPAVRPGDRRAGRGPDQAQEARPRLQGGRAGRELAQAAAGHRRRRARAAGQARRPAAQHAHAGPHAAGEARRASPRRRWTSTRRSPGAWACRSMREELEDLAFRELNPEAYAIDHRRGSTSCASATSDLIARDRAAS